ncbi:hypothetical protein FACS189496_3700 [Bacilli bacterium]|nr:hypothetical protein FACS189496_3700 [Bacilli bacterium]
MIPFNKPPYLGIEMENIQQALNSNKLCGDGQFTKECHHWIEENTGTVHALLTTSCTHALEMSAILADIEPGDEVIMAQGPWMSYSMYVLFLGVFVLSFISGYLYLKKVGIFSKNK